MNGKIWCAIGFGVGAGVGAVTAWYFTKTTYERIIENELNKDRIQRLEEKKEKATEAKKETPHVHDKKPDLKEYADKIRNAGYQNYYKVTDPKEERISPYIITPEEYAEDDDYETESLQYTTDGYLLNDVNIQVTIEETIENEDLLNHFGEYEDDSIYVRNPNTRVDYEVLKVPESYKEDIEPTIPKPPIQMK